MACLPQDRRMEESTDDLAWHHKEDNRKKEIKTKNKGRKYNADKCDHSSIQC